MDIISYLISNVFEMVSLWLIRNHEKKGYNLTPNIKF